jgi:hypothetical protein
VDKEKDVRERELRALKVVAVKEEVDAEVVEVEVKERSSAPTPVSVMHGGSVVKCRRRAGMALAYTSGLMWQQALEVGEQAGQRTLRDHSAPQDVVA